MTAARPLHDEKKVELVRRGGARAIRDQREMPHPLLPSH
eukprot:CAMPEP_0180325410 /NCGR_PEP_ID=MMETSP0988-20121125/38428_1 /TAXON_ID=697907 /ORGANISM="non described non described, Strain CCMP2293" /LENGTH=38 /DNA_ID= /DNA_START= /DNA_END= /DNA_ORIENTATION=